ncbi:MAG TPA: hypothetical protein VEY33_09795 [Gemmatimonadota bacterium]|nr:hypothetical protein [Gemmatimonadota bacterium]
MGSYHLWHPCFVQDDPLTIEAYVTTGDALLDPRGGRELTVSALSALGLADVTSRLLGDSLDAARTHYFSSYRDRQDWQDRWPEVWRWRATLAPGPTPALRAAPAGNRYDLDAPGSMPQDAKHWTCLLVVDAATDAISDRAAELIAAARPGALLERARALDRFPQLRVNLGRFPVSWFVAGATEAEELLAALDEVGASMSVEALLREPFTGSRSTTSKPHVRTRTEGHRA